MSHTSSHSNPFHDRVAAHLAPLLPAGSKLLLGLSGGMDSVVLLHVLHSLAPKLGFTLSSMHVHHGISPNADAWARFCTELCQRYAIPLEIKFVDIAPLKGAHGIEASARKMRHAAFAESACHYIALAHHADDQAETLMLQLLRGAGVRGVSAMPSVREQGSQLLLRPMLEIGRTELLAYAQQYDLEWIEDESNADDSYPRNFLRHRLFPVLAERFPAWRDTLGRSAQHFAEAAGILDEVARADGAGEQILAVAKLEGLSHARGKNLLRHHLHLQGAQMPQEAQLDDMLRQLCGARDNADVCVNFGEWQVRRYRGQIHVMHTLPAFDPMLRLQWRGEASLFWSPLQRDVHFTSVVGQGISRERLLQGQVSLRLRNGGETLRPHPLAARRSMKNLLQEHGVPPWQRERLPLLYCGEELVCVVGVAVAASFLAEEGEQSVMVA
ncbi:MAG: tRNA lysidine(34) synthetase TilS [Gammaproteobacteria bacterium]|nr:tRNA lysidine(34) synthetase TilS [Gammaproteobacteria bacterium]MBU1625310.1 tRNA lysidine(34) synthetase TilS [Gammaproteobacteria bacterium]MBU1981570.1 tRNA lysidine(34) synthetase TilS [Gammaproteobacteria bacterium]